MPKPFLLLAGISGTGKTRFVRQQANSHNLNSKNFCLVPVRPDWHEPSDLLGYISRVGGKPEYVSTKVLQFIIEAWKAVAPNSNNDGMGELNLNSAPYWLCLDEMNLAPVEQYFADYLSVLESREFIDGKYSCDPLLDKSVLKTEGANIQKDLNLVDDQNLWEYFYNNGISLPPNMIVAGTVNMDETTHGFSRKVIDRALSIDFGEFFPNDYKKYMERTQNKPKTMTYSTKTHFSRTTFECSADIDGSKTATFLDEVNNILRNTPFELAYRALNEALLHVDIFKPDTEEKLQAVWDDFLMTKVLPRIDGDDDKLRIVLNDKPVNLLDQLETVLSDKLNLIWSEDKKRIDLLQIDENGLEIDDILCRSRKKISWMRNRLDVNTFTSYWP
ncbi:restriction endonuclease [Thalassotalea sp. PS06]|nr:restriction endonuclease [Thalassotalea sp. PS06]